MTVPSGTDGIVTSNGTAFPDCFFMGSNPGLIDDMISNNELSLDMNMSWDSIANGHYVDYSTQPYINHLWGKSYVSRSIIENKEKHNMKLQILVPQYKETEEVIKPLLDSVALQQGIDFNEVGVIIVNDGYTESKLSKKFLKSYPFKIEYHMENHGGVSATRNKALDYATADYVMFCDADDMFFSMVGLNIIFAEMNKGFSSLTTKFYEELHNDKGDMWFTEHKNDRTFVHGKFHNRQYLIDNNIRFNEKLTVHEDSYFNMLATTCAPDADSIKYSDVPIYLWKWRDDSVCRHDPLYMQKTYKNYIDSITALIDQLKERGKEDNAKLLMCSQMFDTYYLMNTDKWLKQENQEYRMETEKRFKEFYAKYSAWFNELSVSYKVNISNQVRANKIKAGMGMEKQTFDQWIEYINGL